MRSWFNNYSVEIKQLAAGLAVFVGLAGLVVAYSTAIQTEIAQHPALASIVGAIIAFAMTVTVYLNPSRYLFLIAVPLVVTCAIVWILLTKKTLHHVDFYTSTIAQSVKDLPAQSPQQSSAVSPEDRARFRRAHKQLTRSSERLRHHLDRHAFWSRTLLVIAVCTVAIGFLPQIVRRRTPPAD